MKRILMVLAMTAALAGLASAQDSGVRVGGGLGFLVFTNDQKISDGVDSQENKSTYQFWGGRVFADFSRYLTVYGGIWVGVGDAEANNNGVLENDDITATNELVEGNLGAELKFPLDIGEGFALSPKIGLDSVFFWGGDVGGSAPESGDEQQSISPLSVTFGADLDWKLDDGWTMRVPLDLGVAVNARLSDSYYDGFYDSSSVISFRTGLEVAHRL